MGTHNECTNFITMSEARSCLPAGFDPSSLSVAVSDFTLHLAMDDAFVAAVAAEQDYDEGILVQFHTKVAAGELGTHEHASRLASLIAQVGILQELRVMWRRRIYAWNTATFSELMYESSCLYRGHLWHSSTCGSSCKMIPGLDRFPRSCALVTSCIRHSMRVKAL